jgi:hypothetical protein
VGTDLGPLVVLVQADPGAAVTFTAPDSGPSGTFPGGATRVTVTKTSLDSHVFTPTFTANGTVGDYVVTAALGGGTASVNIPIHNVAPDAVIDGTPAPDWVSLSSPQVVWVPLSGLESVGSMYCGIFWGDPAGTSGVSVLRQLSSFTFNGNGGSDGMNVNLSDEGPHLPGPIRFNAGPNSASTLVCNIYSSITTSGSRSGADGAAVTQPGRVVADGQAVEYQNVSVIFLQYANAINAGPAPDSWDRYWAFNLGHTDSQGNPTPLSPEEQFVQALYLDALGRSGSLKELDSWVAALNAPGGSPQAVAAGIEGSVEAQYQLVRSWFPAYLSRLPHEWPDPYEEVPWVNLLQAGESPVALCGAVSGRLSAG